MWPFLAPGGLQRAPGPSKDDSGRKTGPVERVGTSGDRVLKKSKHRMFGSRRRPPEARRPSPGPASHPEPAFDGPVAHRGPAEAENGEKSSRTSSLEPRRKSTTLKIQKSAPGPLAGRVWARISKRIQLGPGGSHEEAQTCKTKKKTITLATYPTPAQCWARIVRDML